MLTNITSFSSSKKSVYGMPFRNMLHTTSLLLLAELKCIYLCVCAKHMSTLIAAHIQSIECSITFRYGSIVKWSLGTTIQVSYLLSYRMCDVSRVHRVDKIVCFFYYSAIPVISTSAMGYDTTHAFSEWVMKWNGENSKNVEFQISNVIIIRERPHHIYSFKFRWIVHHPESGFDTQWIFVQFFFPR